LPSSRFRRTIGSWANIPTDLEGKRIDAAAFEARRDEWLPSDEDHAFIKSLMQPVTEVGKIAGWIAPPERGIKGLPFEYEYVRGGAGPG
jgi:benzoyl-CoA 2,3-dioxygenase component B